MCGIATNFMKGMRSMPQNICELHYVFHNVKPTNTSIIMLPNNATVSKCKLAKLLEDATIQVKYVFHIHAFHWIS